MRLSQCHELTARFFPKSTRLSRPATSRRLLPFQRTFLMESYEVKWDDFKMKRSAD
jgi:hypothetical protein